MNLLLTESDGFSKRALAVLRKLGTVRLENLAGPALDNEVRDCDVLWVRLRHRIGAETMDAAQRLKWIVTPTTGLNHIDLPAARKRGIRVLSLRGETDFLKEIRATAELTVGLMLALLRRIPAAAQAVRGGVWDRDRFQGRELYRRKVGLIGFGRVGRLVAGYLLAFGSRVSAYDPRAGAVDLPGVEGRTLDAVLAGSHLVSLHASFEPEGERFFNAACFARMRCHAWFVNTARGELVDEAALLAALETGRLAGAALDVLTAETSLDLDRHPLVRFARTSDRLILTPHIGGCTHESLERVEHFMALKLTEALACAAS